MTATLKIEHLIKDFGTLRAINDVSFSAEQGEIIALLGPNGAGKSTLMNMITGYLAPTSGTIEISGKRVSENNLFTREQIGFLPEGSPLYPDMNVAAFLNYIAELRGLHSDEKHQRLAEVYELAQIQNVLTQKIETLSKGYCRRVGFAQSIISNPPILLLDEPTDGLDPNQKEHIRKQITELGKNKTILISTHLLDEAETICNRIILINKGEIKADGSLTNILKQTRSITLADAFRKLTTENRNA